MPNKLTLMTDEDIIEKAVGQVTRPADINGKTEPKYLPYLDGFYSPIIFGIPESEANNRVKLYPGVRLKIKSRSEYDTQIAYVRLSIPYLSFYKLDAFNSMMTQCGLPTYKKLKDIWSYRFLISEIKKSDELNAEFSEDSTEDIDMESNKDDSTDYNSQLDDFVDDAELLKEAESQSGPEDSDNLGIYETYELTDQSGKSYELKISELTDGTDYKFNTIGLFGLYKLSSYKTKFGKDLSFIKQFINFVLPVISPSQRPYSFLNLNGQTKISISPITTYYEVVMQMNDLLVTAFKVDFNRMVDVATFCCAFDSIIDQLMKSFSIFQPSKQSLIRSSMETRVGRSGRSTIVAAPDLDIDTVRLPRSLVYKSLEQDVIMKLRDMPGVTNAAMEYRDVTPKALEVFNEIVKNSICTMDRNPTLHKFSMAAFHIELWDEISIGLPNLVDEGFNADYDGDQMFYIIYTDPLIVASMEDLLPSKNWLYEKNNNSPYTPKHETLYGLFLATDKPSAKPIKGYPTMNDMNRAWDMNQLEVTDRVQYNNIVDTYGRHVISDILGFNVTDVIGDDNINDKNIVVLIRLLGSKPDRAKRLRDLQNFGDKIATINGLGAIPFEELYKSDPEVVKKILNSNEPNEIKMKQLDEYESKQVKNAMDNLTETNIGELVKGSGRVKLSSVKSIYAPSIKLENGELVINSTNMFEGLTEKAYTDMGAHNRAVLQFKQALTPVAGYNQRQLVMANMELMYDGENTSKDTVGIVLRLKDAIGRTKIDGSIVTGGNPDELIRVRSCVNNTDNIVYKDQLSIGKFNLRQNSGIGISFADSLAEYLYQKSLGLKHGSPLMFIEDASVKAIEGGKVTKITRDYLQISGQHEYKYLINNNCAAADGISEGSYVTTDEVIIRSTKKLNIDHSLSEFNTLIKTQVTGDYAKYLDSGICYAPESGVINYSTIDGTVNIGSSYFKLDKNELYFYPEGYKVNKGDRISTGVLDIGAYYKLSADIGFTYYCFYMNFMSFFGFVNSELLEVLFRCIKNYGFSVVNKNNDVTDITRSLYVGAGKSKMARALVEASKNADSDRVSIPVMNNLATMITLMN